VLSACPCRRFSAQPAHNRLVLPISATPCGVLRFPSTAVLLPRTFFCCERRVRLTPITCAAVVHTGAASLPRQPRSCTLLTPPALLSCATTVAAALALLWPCAGYSQLPTRACSLPCLWCMLHFRSSHNPSLCATCLLSCPHVKTTNTTPHPLPPRHPSFFILSARLPVSVTLPFVPDSVPSLLVVHMGCVSPRSTGCKTMRFLLLLQRIRFCRLPLQMTTLLRGCPSPIAVSFALLIATAVTACENLSSNFPVNFGDDCSTNRLERVLHAGKHMVLTLGCSTAPLTFTVVVFGSVGEFLLARGASLSLLV
jgi:hypothetical protein